ncbi:unnamed protein product [Boreogadus saida]
MLNPTGAPSVSWVSGSPPPPPASHADLWVERSCATALVSAARKQEKRGHAGKGTGVSPSVEVSLSKAPHPDCPPTSWLSPCVVVDSAVGWSPVGTTSRLVSCWDDVQAVASELSLSSPGMNHEKQANKLKSFPCALNNGTTLLHHP